MAKKSSQSPGAFPIKLTALQREALGQYTRVKASIKSRLSEADEGTQAVSFSQRELDHLEDELGQAAVYVPNPAKKRIVAVLKKVQDILNEQQLAAFGGQTLSQRKHPSSQSPLLFQFKITLQEISPVIWRRIQVQDGPLADLHGHIQAAFGWEDYHMHQFEVDGERYGTPVPDDFDFGVEMIDESNVLLSDLLPKSGARRKWVYTYDFGDGWRHVVIFEGYPPIDHKAKYPICLEGERACPPEDVGGPWGYAEYLAAIADPKHERHDEYLEWRGAFDSQAFDAKKATREMRKR